MRIVLALVLVACAGASLGGDLGVRQPAKPAAAVIPNVPEPARQGGDTVADATLISDIPYYSTGTTTGFNDDYDEVCPYSGSTAPDVVYAHTPAMERVLTFDMYGSEYDTKIYIYDQDLNLVACNDDYYPDYVSLLAEVPLEGGVTYYLVVDGWNGDHGDYVLNIVEYEPCVLECPPGGTPEGEPPLVDDYEDAYNGGCNSPEYGIPFQELFGDANGDLVLCGVAGWYLYNGMNYRDTDWFHLYAGPTGTVEVTAHAERSSYIVEGGPHDCSSPAVIQLLEVEACNTTFMTMTGYDPGGLIWFIALSTTFSPPYPDFGYEYDYIVEFSGLMPTPVATETATWTTVKSLFR